MHQRLIPTIICALCALCFFPRHALAAEQDLRILTSTFPIYQITRNVTYQVDKARVELMIPAGSGCPHDYALTPRDMQQLAQANILVLNGLGMEDFLETPLARAKASLHVIDSSQGIDPKLLITIAHQDNDRQRRDHQEINAHLYVSPKLTAQLALFIGEQLAKLDPDNAAVYQKNAQSYAERLRQLADAFHALGTNTRNPEIVAQFAVFDYLLRDAGLHIAALIPAHEGTDPSAAELLALIREIKHKQASAIFIEPRYAGTIGAAVAGETKLPLVELDPLSSGPDKAPLDYYEQMMQANLRTLEQTLVRN